MGHLLRPLAEERRQRTELESWGINPHIYLKINIQKESHTRHIRGFSNTRKFSPTKFPNFWVFKRNPTSVHIRGCLTTEKFRPPKCPNFGGFKRNPRTRTHTRIFDHWKIHPCEMSKFWGFKRNPTRVHIRGFLTTGKFRTLKISNFKVFKRNPHTRSHTRIFDHWKIQNPENPKF